MRKNMFVFLLFFLVVILTSCSDMKTANGPTKRPELTFKTEQPKEEAIHDNTQVMPDEVSSRFRGFEKDGFLYAGKIESYKVEYNDFTVYVYYEITAKRFKAIIENESDEAIEGMTVKVVLDTGKVFKCDENLQVDVGETRQFAINKYSVSIFDGWRIEIETEGIENSKEPEITIEEAKVVQQIKISPTKLELLSNHGIVIDDKQYAGINQMMKIETSKLSITIMSSNSKLNQEYLVLKISNKTQETLNNIGYKFIFDKGLKSERSMTSWSNDHYRIYELEAGQNREYLFGKSSNYDDYQIYRLDLKLMPGSSLNKDDIESAVYEVIGPP